MACFDDATEWLAVVIGLTYKGYSGTYKPLPKSRLDAKAMKEYLEASNRPWKISPLISGSDPQKPLVEMEDVQVALKWLFERARNAA